ncbi:MAG: AsnC family transcriptional regulator [Streptosporangiales bacterium]|nr:AsnC family transcriptional regulator [Streptosporangiales bacterium]
MMPLEMENLDPIDRRIVAALQVNGRASWTEIAPLAGTSVTTVARRAQQLLSDGIVRVTAVAQPNGAGPVDHLTVRLRCAPGRQLDVARAVAQLPEVRLATLVTGAFDVVAELLIPKGRGVRTLVVDGLQQISGIERTVAELQLHVYKMSHDWSRALLPEAAGPADVPKQTHACAPEHLDAIDHQIVEALREDGRAAFQAVAAGLGVSESTVRRRFETLTQKGCVLVVTLVPAAALGFEAEVLFWLSVTPDRLDEAARQLAALRGVRYVAATLGRESLMCEVILPSTEDLFHFTTTTLAGVPGIQAWSANLELLTLKRAFVHVPWSARELGPAG